MRARPRSPTCASSRKRSRTQPPDTHRVDYPRESSAPGVTDTAGGGRPVAASDRRCQRGPASFLARAHRHVLLRQRVVGPTWAGHHRRRSRRGLAGASRGSLRRAVLQRDVARMAVGRAARPVRVLDYIGRRLDALRRLVAGRRQPRQASDAGAARQRDADARAASHLRRLLPVTGRRAIAGTHGTRWPAARARAAGPPVSDMDRLLPANDLATRVSRGHRLVLRDALGRCGLGGEPRPQTYRDATRGPRPEQVAVASAGAFGGAHRVAGRVWAARGLGERRAPCARCRPRPRTGLLERLVRPLPADLLLPAGAREPSLQAWSDGGRRRSVERADDSDRGTVVPRHGHAVRPCRRLSGVSMRDRSVRQSQNRSVGGIPGSGHSQRRVPGQTGEARNAIRGRVHGRDARVREDPAQSEPLGVWRLRAGRNDGDLHQGPGVRALRPARHAPRLAPLSRACWLRGSPSRTRPSRSGAAARGGCLYCDVRGGSQPAVQLGGVPPASGIDCRRRQ